MERKVVYVDTPVPEGGQATCRQCGLFCSVRSPENVWGMKENDVVLDYYQQGNYQIESGNTRCYACRWANVNLHPGRFKGIGFEDFMQRLAFIEGVMKGGDE